MAKTITRQMLKLFGGAGASSNFTQFGSTVAGSTLRTKDIPTIQAIDAWVNGWQDAVVPANKAPFLEDMNALIYVLGYQLAYLLQDGIPEWQIGTTYFIGSIVRRADTGTLFQSLTNDNVGNALPTGFTSSANWQLLRFGPPTGAITAFGSGSVPDGYLLCDGSQVPIATYPQLALAIGDNFGPTSGGNFTLPDLRGRFLYGKDGTNVVGDVGGAATHTHAQPAHDHTIPSHDHVLLNTGAATSPVTGGDALRSSPSKGATLRYNATFGVGSQVNQVTNQTDTISGVSTGTAQPAIALASNLPPYVVITWIIKT